MSDTTNLGMRKWCTERNRTTELECMHPPEVARVRRYTRAPRTAATRQTPEA
jgi:hypothetical protein